MGENEDPNKWMGFEEEEEEEGLMDHDFVEDFDDDN